MKCPFCLKQEQRILGAIILTTARDFEANDATAAERACSNCLMLMAQLLDHWRNGGINSFVARAKSAGLVIERLEYVESGARRFNN